MDLRAKYDRLAEGFAEHEYADPGFYNARRALAVFGVGPPLRPGGTVLDLGCGDASFAPEVLRRGYAYLGADPSPGMCEAARRRLAGAGRIEQGGFEDFEPPEPVEMTVILRALYLVEDRVAALRRIGRYTTTKVVFDLDARQLSPALVAEEVRAAGFDRLDARPLFVSMRVVPPRPVDAGLRLLERTGPFARAIAARRFRVVCAAYRSA